MIKLVIDASLSASWLLGDEANAKAKWAFEKMQAGAILLVPNLWLLEMTNLLFKAERQRRIDRLYRDEALDRIALFPVTVLAAPTFADLKIIRVYAEKHQLTAYDAEYLRVAKLNQATLASQDANLIAAAKREKMAVA